LQTAGALRVFAQLPGEGQRAGMQMRMAQLATS